MRIYANKIFLKRTYCVIIILRQPCFRVVRPPIDKEVMPYEELRFQRPHGFWDVSLSIADFHSFDGPVKRVFNKKKPHPKLGNCGMRLFSIT